MKKYLFLAVAALGLAACAEKGMDNNGPANNGELEQSYVAITLAASDMNTKADDGVYAEGTDEERAVKSAYVFFFKDGAAFPVKFDGTTSTNEGPNNYLLVSPLTGDEEDMPNVSDVKDAVLVLQNYKGEYPNQIVAVLNWDPTAKASYTLDELKTKISALGNDTDGYVMSNAVYADAKAKTVDAVDLTIANIGKTAAEAIANPVTIHVERVAAKVVFTAAGDGRFAIEKEINGKPVYAQIKGFELYNDYQESWLIKRINPSWTDLGFNWNDVDFFRSYWAQSLDQTFDENTFAWNTDNTGINGFVYCGENTRSWTEAADVRTKVIVKAQLVDVNGNPFEVVNWYGKDYIEEDELKTVVANTLKNTYYSSADASTFIGLTPADIKCVGRLGTDANAYEVYFQLSEDGAKKMWYKKEADGTYTYVTGPTINNALAAVQPALVYKNGMTYYWTEIKHLGAAGKTAEYGIVRNHVYKVNITDITGYGTPVYNGTTDFITPDKPDDIVTYVSAQINILSWRVVANDYQLN